MISNISFKGSRDYLQGPDIYNWLTAAMPAAGIVLSGASFQLSFHRMAHHQLVIGTGNEIPPEAAISEPAAQVTLSRNGAVTAVKVYETSLAPTERVAYDEKPIADACAISEKTIRIAGMQALTPMEILVSMTKLLHLALFPTQGKWIFVRIELQRLLTRKDSESFQVSILQTVQSKFSKSQVTSSGEPLGFIYFSIL